VAFNQKQPFALPLIYNLFDTISLKHSLTLSHILLPLLTHSHKHILALFLTHSHILSHNCLHPLYLSFSLCVLLSLSLSLFLSLSLSLSLSLTHTHTLLYQPHKFSYKLFLTFSGTISLSHTNILENTLEHTDQIFFDS